MRFDAAGKRQLGLYWGQNSFSFVETEKGKLLKAVYLPFNTPLDTDQQQDIPDNLRFTALIQKAIREHNFTAKKVHLTINTKDLIFRSFTIPWMQAEEVKNVVDFEATKYIPIQLENLAYTFHSIPVTENNQKKLRILFVAIQKNTLEKFVEILQHVGWQVESIEPGPVSVVRILQKTGQLAGGQSSAIIELGENGGKILIVEQDVVHFVRDFVVPNNPKDIALWSANLFNDIRVSFNFYTRQNPKGKIDKIVILSPAVEMRPVAVELAKELNIATVALSPSDVLKTPTAAHTELINAYGAAIRDRHGSTKNFDLASKIAKLAKASNESTWLQKIDVQMLVVVLAGCAFTVLLTRTLAHNLIAGQKKQLEELRSKQGKYESLKIPDLQKMQDELENKLTAYKDVRTRSGTTDYLLAIPQLLPPGIWLSSLNISYAAVAQQDSGASRQISKAALILEGYAYSDKSNEQFRMVNNFLNKLRTEKDFAAAFTDITLVNIAQQTYSTFVVTRFQITCK